MEKSLNDQGFASVGKVAEISRDSIQCKVDRQLSMRLCLIWTIFVTGGSLTSEGNWEIEAGLDSKQIYGAYDLFRKAIETHRSPVRDSCRCSPLAEGHIFRLSSLSLSKRSLQQQRMFVHDFNIWKQFETSRYCSFLRDFTQQQTVIISGRRCAKIKLMSSNMEQPQRMKLRMEVGNFAL
nr:hypothetical protein [Tanacetum cinerariifolium]